jgi:hypothetical protein
VVILYAAGYTGVDLLVYVSCCLHFFSFHFHLLFFELLVELAFRDLLQYWEIMVYFEATLYNRTSSSTYAYKRISNFCKKVVFIFML